MIMASNTNAIKSCAKANTTPLRGSRKISGRVISALISANDANGGSGKIPQRQQQQHAGINQKKPNGPTHELLARELFQPTVLGMLHMKTQ